MTSLPAVWAEFGFSRNPYATEPVPPSDDGEFLLVGREQELADLTARLTASSTIPVLVGANGVGKTSIVSVAAHRLSRVRGEDGPTYLALYPPLQLESTQSVDLFERDAFYHVAKVLLDQPKFLVRRGVRRRQIRAMRRWLRDPAARQQSVGLSTPFGGGSWQTGATPSDSDGFKNAGMQMMVEEWLDLCFPDEGSGGIICLIDNLEILNTSAQARQAVESLRDGLFAKRGLRWVLCGTPAVVGGRALFSARMEGRIAPPIQIRPIATALAPELVARRLERFGSPDAYPPVDERGFERIYAVVNARLRSALDLCQQYAIFLHTHRRRPEANERLEALDRWLAARANEFAPATSDVHARSWRLFDDLSDIGGEIRSSDAEVLRFDNAEELVVAATALCRTGLLERVEADDGDYLLQVTTPGWLVRFQRRDYEI